jgi:DNA-binding winged helix-turn-helix (wHTH) protein
VTFDFGPFRLDEPGRALRLADREMALQPRVFDLLAYLVRHRSRVVSKDELLDALWPGVTVTDNSLQRAVSTLRGVLREGGMEDAVRNFPRAGYRFCIEQEHEASASCDAQSKVPSNEIEAARQAAQEQRWHDAKTLYKQVDVTRPLAGHDLDRWALALQCLGKPSEAIPVLVRSVASYAQAADNDLAAQSAVMLSAIHLERGEAAVAKGWLARAADFVGARRETYAWGLVLWMQARLAAADGNPHEAVRLADAAYEVGRRCNCARVEALGLMYRGFFKLSLGDTRDGLADQDHAAALALSNSIDPITGGVLYCNILWACRTFGDWARANQWTLGYQEFCTGHRMGFWGSCQLHRAEVLGVRGSLHDALAHIGEALAHLGDDAPWAIGDAHRVLGDIHAAIGNTAEAQTAYEKSYSLGWDPEPGHALLLLDLGQPEAAYASLERSLIGQSWWTLQRQGMLLAHLAIVAAHAGRYERAAALIDDLAGQESRWPMPSIRALTNEAMAVVVQKQRGDLNEALRHLHLARQLWTSIDSRLNATRLRLAIATLQLDVGDANGAATELRAISAVIDKLGSDKLMQQTRTLQRRLQ